MIHPPQLRPTLVILAIGAAPFQKEIRVVQRVPVSGANDTRLAAAPGAHVREAHREQSMECGRSSDQHKLMDHELERAHHQDQIRVSLQLQHVLHVRIVHALHNGHLRRGRLRGTERGLEERSLHSL